MPVTGSLITCRPPARTRPADSRVSSLDVSTPADAGPGCRSCKSQVKPAMQCSAPEVVDLPLPAWSRWWSRSLPCVPVPARVFGDGCGIAHLSGVVRAIGRTTDRRSHAPAIRQAMQIFCDICQARHVFSWRSPTAPTLQSPRAGCLSRCAVRAGSQS